jgi:hypothetical protein
MDLRSTQKSLAALDEGCLARFRRLFGSARELAQASHSAAGISPTEGTASRVISDKAIEDLKLSNLAISHRARRPMVQDRASWR